MCTEVDIKRKGMRRPLTVSSVRDLARYFRVIVPVASRPQSNRIRRMARHCLCPVDVAESAKRSGYRVVAEPGFCPDIIVEKI